LTLIGGYKLTGVSSNAVYSDSIGNITGFALSGHSDSTGIACCLYVWSDTGKCWIPMTQP